MHFSVTFFIFLLAYSIASELQRDVVKEPYNLCSSPLEELKSLELVELRQYEAIGEKVCSCTVSPGGTV